MTQRIKERMRLGSELEIVLTQKTYTNFNLHRLKLLVPREIILTF
jgi:hypothetical protein